jgi:hypothetical protein
VSYPHSPYYYCHHSGIILLLQLLLPLTGPSIAASLLRALIQLVYTSGLPVVAVRITGSRAAAAEQTKAACASTKVVHSSGTSACMSVVAPHNTCTHKMQPFLQVFMDVMCNSKKAAAAAAPRPRKA